MTLSILPGSGSHTMSLLAVVSTLVLLAASHPCGAEKLVDLEELHLNSRLVVDMESIHEVHHLQIVDLIIVHATPSKRNDSTFNRVVLRTAIDCRNNNTVLVRRLWYFDDKQVSAEPETASWRSRLGPRYSPHGADDSRWSKILQLVCHPAEHRDEP